MPTNGALTSTALPITPPPSESLESNLRQLLQEEPFDKDCTLYPSPGMEQEEYLRQQYGSSYSESRQSVGLGIQYVC